MAFPTRVNIVYGSRWALAKKGWGDCPVDVVPASEMLRKNGYRKSCDFRWIIDGAASPGFLIRSDHHPRRALRGGIPVMVESKRGASLNQRWHFIYRDTVVTPDTPFHIRSAISGMYLTVNEGHRSATLQRDEPEMCWRFHNATSRFKTLRGKPRTGADTMLTDASLPLAACRQCVNTGEVLGPDVEADDPSEEDTEDERLSAFDGPLATAFGEVPAAGAEFDCFTSLHDMLTTHRLDLCDSVVVGPRGSSLLVEDLFEALFCRRGDFLKLYQDIRRGRIVEWNPPEPHEHAPWFATASLRCQIHVPVLGERPYSEVQRYVLCRDQDQVTLALQQVGRIEAGRFGEFRSESLYLFSQRSGGPIMLKAVGLAPKGYWASKAVDGYNKALVDFRTAMAAALAARPHGSPTRAATRPGERPAASGDTSPLRGSRSPSECCGAGLARAGCHIQ